MRLPRRVDGKNCEHDIRPCAAKKPCKNDALCHNVGVKEYKCACKPGYAGKDCEKDIHPCVVGTPCKNKGLCQRSAFPGYSCKCLPGYSGKYCEVTPCTPAPCKNGGICKTVKDHYSCDCSRIPFSGTHCEKDEHPCAVKNPCKNGVCRRTHMMEYKCDCAKGYTGVICQTFDCKNGGKFGQEQGSGKNICYCKPGFTGVQCEKKCKKVERKLDIVFVVDGSGSLKDEGDLNWRCDMPSKHWSQELEFIDDVIETLNIGKDQSRVSVVQFAGAVGRNAGKPVREEISFDDSVKLGKKQLMSSVKEIKWSAGLNYAVRYGRKKCKHEDVGWFTATPDGMVRAEQIFKEKGRMADKSVKKLVFIITDGEIQPREKFLKAMSDGSGRDALTIAKDLNKLGVETYSIGVSLKRSEVMNTDLLNMAAGKEDHRFIVSNFDDLKDKVLGTIQNSLNCDV